MISCPVCGPYEIEDLLLDARESIDKVTRRRIAFLVRNYADENHGVAFGRAFTLGNYKDIALASHMPASLDEQTEHLLSYVAKHTEVLGDYTRPSEKFEVWATRLGLVHEDERRPVPRLLKWLGPSERDWITTFWDGEDGPVGVGLTPEGWTEARKLRQTTRAGNRVFVAMSFAKDMREVYDAAIKPVLEEVGLDPIRIDRETVHGRIPDEIMAAIRRSRLVVADFTGGRGGVYFEAGFAMGLDIPVIWMCRHDSMDDLHFDTRQYQHIDWDDLADLRNRLSLRIAAYGWDRPVEPRD